MARSRRPRYLIETFRLRAILEVPIRVRLACSCTMRHCAERDHDLSWFERDTRPPGSGASPIRRGGLPCERQPRRNCRRWRKPVWRRRRKRESDSPPGMSFGRRRPADGGPGALLAMMVTAVEQLVVSPAMATIIAQLKGFEIFPWVASAYLLAATVSTPLYGKLADLFGASRSCSSGLVSSASARSFPACR